MGSGIVTIARGVSLVEIGTGASSG